MLETIKEERKAKTNVCGCCGIIYNLYQGGKLYCSKKCKSEMLGYKICHLCTHYNDKTTYCPILERKVKKPYEKYCSWFVTDGEKTAIKKAYGTLTPEEIKEHKKESMNKWLVKKKVELKT